MLLHEHPLQKGLRSGLPSRYHGRPACRARCGPPSLFNFPGQGRPAPCPCIVAQSVLGSLTLCYQLLWNRRRELAGIRLLAYEDGEQADGGHLLRTLTEMWTAESPTLLVAPRSPRLLAGMLEHADGESPMIEVPVDWLDPHELRESAQAARERGAVLIAASGPGRRRPDFPGRSSPRTMELQVDDAAAALQAVLRAREIDPRQPGQRIAAQAQLAASPIEPDQIVVGAASMALVEHALDQRSAWAVAGWPIEDVLHRNKGQPLPPTRRAVVRTMQALESEQTLDELELQFGQEPALAYRLLLHLNSAGLGLRRRISSLRHGVMMLGYRTLDTWLAEQLPHTSDDRNLLPANTTMVLRAHLTSQLMEAGVEEELRREVYLCGLFAQLDLVMDEPMRVSVSRVSLPDRVVEAILRGSGAYASVLQVAQALGQDNPAVVRATRARFDMGAEEINRSLLRTLAFAIT